MASEAFAQGRFKGSRIQVFDQSRVILSGQEIQVLEYCDGKLEVLWERIDRGKKVLVLLPFAQSEVSQITPHFLKLVFSRKEI